MNANRILQARHYGSPPTKSRSSDRSVSTSKGREHRTAWAKVFADERPDLLDKIVAQMATVKGGRHPAQPTEVAGG